MLLVRRWLLVVVLIEPESQSVVVIVLVDAELDVVLGESVLVVEL